MKECTGKGLGANVALVLVAVLLLSGCIPAVVKTESSDESKEAPAEEVKEELKEVKEVPKDKGQLVREVQTMLSQKGYDPGPLDGKDGPSTQAALRKFQNKQGLPTTVGVTEEAYIQLASDVTDEPYIQSASEGENTNVTSAASECVRNFKKEDGGLRSYGTMVMLDGVAPELATKRLVRALARDGYTTGGDSAQGMVTGEFDVGESSLVFSAFIDKVGQDSQVELHLGAQKVSIGMMFLSDDVYRDDLCAFVDAMRGD